MKKQLQKIKTFAMLSLASLSINAQTTSGLQCLQLDPNSYWNGSTPSKTVSTVGSFTCGACIYPNTYNGTYSYWSSGWAYSNMTDSLSEGPKAQYTSRIGEGHNKSTNYAIGKGGSILKFNANAQGRQMAGFYVTNNAYAYYSMKKGDSFGKIFGDTTGTGSGTKIPQGQYPDWFKLKVQKYLNGVLAPNDSVTFYLADYRFDDNSKDYIVRSWQYVDLTSLGDVDSLKFTLSSSDVGQYGMNTPAYFCMDDFTTLNTVTGLNEVATFEESTFIYPNPSNSTLHISSPRPLDKVELYNQLGSLIYSSKTNNNDISHLDKGIYFVHITNVDGNVMTKRLVKD